MGRNNRGQAKLVNDTKFYCQPEEIYNDPSDLLLGGSSRVFPGRIN